MGDDDEYEELPDYQRDLFWNYKIPGSNVWLSIPKPYENGLVSAIVDRSISKIMGNDSAFDGLTGSILKTLIPIDESSFLGSMKPIVENLTNYDFFRDKSIVNQWDEGKARELRNGDKTASRISQTTTDLLYKAGYDMNPQKLDHLIKGYGTYMGDMALRIGDVGVKDSRFGFGISQLGFAKESPLSNSKTVKKVYDLAESIGYSQKTSIRRLRKMVESYYDAETVEDQKRITREVYAEAKSILPRLEERVKKEKEKATRK